MGRPGAPFYTDPDFLRIAEKHGITIGQVLLSWAVQRGTVPLPKSSNETRAGQNIDVSSPSYPHPLETSVIRSGCDSLTDLLVPLCSLFSFLTKTWRR
jgi:hypothetical protein